MTRYKFNFSIDGYRMETEVSADRYIDARDFAWHEFITRASNASVLRVEVLKYPPQSQDQLAAEAKETPSRYADPQALLA